MMIDDLTEAAGTGLVPEDPDQLHATMEGLPGFFEALAARLGEFSEWLGGEIGDKTSSAVTDLAQAVAGAKDLATEAFVAYQDEAAAWLE